MFRRKCISVWEYYMENCICVWNITCLSKSRPLLNVRIGNLVLNLYISASAILYLCVYSSAPPWLIFLLLYNLTHGIHASADHLDLISLHLLRFVFSPVDLVPPFTLYSPSIRFSFLHSLQFLCCFLKYFWHLTLSKVHHFLYLWFPWYLAFLVLMWCACRVLVLANSSNNILSRLSWMMWRHVDYFCFTFFKMKDLVLVCEVAFHINDFLILLKGWLEVYESELPNGGIW